MVTPGAKLSGSGGKETNGCVEHPATLNSSRMVNKMGLLCLGFYGTNVLAPFLDCMKDELITTY